MRRRRQDQAWPDKLTVSLPAELTARVYRHHRESMLGGTPQDAARDLISVALDFPEVEESLLRSARLRGYTVVRREFWEQAQALLGELDRLWQRQRDVAAVPQSIEDFSR